MLVDILVDFMT